MNNMEKIRQKVQTEKPESGARQIGEVVLLIAAASEQAAEIIAADTDNLFDMVEEKEAGNDGEADGGND